MVSDLSGTSESFNGVSVRLSDTDVGSPLQDALPAKRIRTRKRKFDLIEFDGCDEVEEVHSEEYQGSGDGKTVDSVEVMLYAHKVFHFLGVR